MEPIQSQIKQKGETIFALMEGESKSIFNKDWWYGRIMEWSMKNEHFKTQMFRFVDVLPYLNSGSEVARHLKEYFAESGDELPSVFNFGVGLGSLAPGLMAGAVRKNVTQMAKMFISGETPDESLSVLKKQRKNKIGFTVDLLGEACLSEQEALDYQRRYLELVDWLAKDAANWEHIPLIDEDHLGPIPRVNVSVKLSSLYSQIDLKDWNNSKAVVKERIRPILKQGMQRGVFINLDMEQYELKDFTIEIFKELMMEPEFKSYPHFGCVIQAYLKDSHKDIKDLCAFARARAVPFTVRLVKGAYWDFETVHAAQTGWPVPVYTAKRETDANYEDCALTLLQNHPHIRVALGSHNVRSIAACLVHAERLGIDPRALEVQMLYGMADAIKGAMVKMNIRVREYAPVGELIPGMAYLVRRLLENTSNESFLKSKFADGVDTATLLRDPKEFIGKNQAPPTPVGASATTKPANGQPPFVNDSPVDFGIAANREKVLTALKAMRLAGDYQNVIAGKEVSSSRWIESRNPSHPNSIVGRASAANTEQAQQAIKAAHEAFATWKNTTPEHRAALLDKVADIFQRDRFDIIALEITEAGKQWEEADGDVAEAIDFCRYYAREIRRLSNPQRVGNVPGEVSLYMYQPRGVSVVIAPWNFPLAILCGMVVASVGTGNTCIIKPAEQTPLIGAYLMKALKEAGTPPGVANLLNGYGEEIGDTLTGDPRTAIIGFTGSKAVGLHIWAKAAQHQPGQKHMKKVICEMGGKNAIIIDTDADLDEAIMGVLYSAFGFQGQKCSAASRVIVLDEIYDRFIGRLLEAARSMKVAPSEDPSSFVGPVIDEEAQQRILRMIETGKSEATLAFQGAVPTEGYFVPPTIFTDAKPNSRIAQDEIFGPVMAVIRAKNLDEAIEIANGTEYALTGGVYSRSPANIERVKKEFSVGNLYINRGITGAMVDRHPFGGFNMSGAGSKTGGPDYLLNFLEPRVVTENTLRRGFAPSEDEIASSAPIQ